jgi:dTDP-4-dehydrorhamnose 3,5-epimerase-like enzyme
MPKIISLNTFIDKRGNLTVIDNVFHFDINRVFFIYGVDESRRGGHRHHKTIQAAVCIQGSCKIYCKNTITENIYLLDKPEICLLLEPEDWHEMYEFSNNAILMVFASEKYLKEDYIYEQY